MHAKNTAKLPTGRSSQEREEEVGDGVDYCMHLKYIYIYISCYEATDDGGHLSL